MEREITEAVDLCRPDGRLDRAAVGWTRRPLHRCALPGSWGRRKRWDFWNVTGPDLVVNLTYADVDYVGIVDVWCWQPSTGRTAARSVPVPLARGLHLPDEVGGGPMTFDGGGLAVSITEEAGGTRLRVAFGGDPSSDSAPAPSAAAAAVDEGEGDAAAEGPEASEAGAGFRADVLVTRPDGHESLGVVIPWSDRRFQYTTKDVARPAEGTVAWGGETHVLDATDGRSWGCLDFGRGKWPYRTRWNWGAAAGLVEGAGDDGPARVGLQLGGRWTVGTGMTENALCVDGRLSKVSEELEWTYDRSDWLRPWRIRARRSGRVDLTFTPVHDKVARLQLGVAAQSVDQCFGTYEGTIAPDDGPPIAVGDLFGWAEEATWRW